ncbi:AAA domain-containing protein [Pelagophyceae sp. CCMP2097]|nr:AAA domain-containing protein [Pelagophyceae sp. CCMP2097]
MRRRGAALVYGANTDVGKTAVSGGLVQAALRRRGAAAYLKPVQTGVRNDDEGDAAAIRRYAAAVKRGRLVACETLHSWLLAASPHVAAALEERGVPTDSELAAGVGAWLERHEASELDAISLILETAGGVLSPTPQGGLQADAFAPLHQRFGLKSVLVGDAKLGGVSVTLCALECLERRGLHVDAVVFVGGDAALGNAAYVRERCGGNRVVCELEPLPPMPRPLDDWLESAAPSFDALHDQIFTKE